MSKQTTLKFLTTRITPCDSSDDSSAESDILATVDDSEIVSCDTQESSSTIEGPTGSITQESSHGKVAPMECPVSESPFDALISHSRVLSNSEKYQLVTTQQSKFSDGALDTRFFKIKGSNKRKQITFQMKWLQEYSWLRYCNSEDNKGGWCLPCILFLTEQEKFQLGGFVKNPFVNYNKANELCKKHTSKEYHKRAIDRAYAFKSSYSNPHARIDNRLLDVSSENFKLNSKILPPIVDAVLTCARQRIALQGHMQDKIDFNSPPLLNEGNFIALLRLLAKNNTILKEHLVSGARNAKYTSKTVQNEILQVAADL